MRKCLSILIIFLLCAFLFVSCDAMEDILGELISGEGESYDYSKGGGGSVETLSGTWEGNTTEFNDSFSSLVDCKLTVTMDAEGNFTLSEVDDSDTAIKQFEGTYSLDGMLVTIDIKDPKTKKPDSSKYIFIRKDGAKYSLYEGSSADELAKYAEYEDDDGNKLDVGRLFNEYVVDGTKLSLHSEDNILGLSITDVTYEFNSLENPTTLRKSKKVANMESEDIVLDATERVVVDNTLTKDTKPNEADMLVHFEEESYEREKLSIWYSYDSETDKLTLYWSAEPITLTRK
ncbi:MAG: hypothetical protein IJR16_02250 [Spirochaetales bacterium]|nr:hypothetical protein [Spirochaetales bacterium]